jgi:hypothetical protein
VRNPYEYPTHCEQCNDCELDERGECVDSDEHVLCARHLAEAREAEAEARWERDTGR